jgi:hypothetical protein
VNLTCRLFALIAFALFPGAVTFAADFPTLPNDSWYRVEVVIFERLGDVDAASTQEILVTRTPRAYPPDIVAFDDEASRAAAYPLDAETRAEAALPSVDAATIVANRSTQAQPAPRPPTAPPTPADRAAKAIADYQSQLQDRAYRFEPSNTLLLAQEDSRLQRSNLYRVVFHHAWIQPVPDRDQLRPMLIQVGERIGAGWRIEGFLGITRGRYLHMDTRLWYAADRTQNPTSADAPAIVGDDAPYMELREQRRMRSGELHYLDHPKFGVLARVDPVVPPEALVTELARLAAMPAQ